MKPQLYRGWRLHCSRISKIDRGPLDHQKILGKVFKIENDVYQIGTNHGILNNSFSCTNFIISGINFSGDIPEKFISLGKAISVESKFGGQGYSSCNCCNSQEQCQTKRCARNKAGALCNYSRCHRNSAWR